MAERTIAIGDVHGCLTALNALLEAIDPQPDDTIVTLGDYVDRGPDSRGVLERLIALERQCRLVPMLGNHDEMLLEICNGRIALIEEWVFFGGAATIASYGGRVPEGVPGEHVNFLRTCRSVFESPRHFFVHGNYDAAVPLESQPGDLLRWESLKFRQPGPHCSGKTAIVGHTSQKNGEILELGHLRCIDTYCYGDGWLTALDVDTDRVWQADKEGKMRQ